MTPLPPSPVRRRLIVNADDFGLSPGVNTGIAEAHRGGILTSATLLANAPAFAEAVALAKRHPGLGVGVHLNLVRGRPLSPPGTVPTLVNATGGLRRFRLRRMTPGFLRDAEREYRRQIEKVLAAGLVPSHLDFEKHHAWQAGLYGLACRLADEYGIGAVRNLREPVWWAWRHMGWPGWRGAAEAALLRAGLTLFGGAADRGVAGPDRLLGQTHIGQMTEGVWERLLAAVPEGVSEVMVHPGRPESDCDGDGAASGMGTSRLAGSRGAELRALLSEGVRRAVAAAGVELVTYRIFQTQYSTPSSAVTP